jgi:hypothetical protein
MKMKNVFSLKTLSIAAALSISLLYSCKKDNESISSSDSQTANSESVSESTSTESSDMGNSVISNVSYSDLGNARVTSKSIMGLELKDPRLAGATISITGSGGSSNPSGTITIDFGAGVTTNGVTRKGIITIAYQGKRFQKDATRSITFTNYYRNSVKVDGTYDLTVQDSTSTSSDLTVTFSHITNLTLTFPDNTTITRNAAITSVWDYNINNPDQSTVTLKTGGTAGGTTRLGKEYAMEITKDIVRRADCWKTGFHLPVSGTKTITVLSTTQALPRVFTIDFGSTICDNTITVLVGGKTFTITVSASGN